jgi:hypothetical protein
MPPGFQEGSKNFDSYTSDLFNATVVSCDPATICVNVSPDGEFGNLILQAHPLASTYSAALGFNETILPGVGTRVLCQGKSGDSTILIGCLPHIEPQADENTAGLANRVILGTREPVHDNVHRTGYGEWITKAAVLNNNLPTDVTQGEKVIANEFGVMMGLFKLMANLKASELAQVQVHFLDDLVRIISHNFQHYTALGEFKIFHDGKGIHLEMGATHSPGESIGKSSNSGTEALSPGSDEENEYLRFYKMSHDQLNMLERMKLFVGKLGDFVNFLLVKPSDTAHTLNGDPPQNPDTGLLQIKAAMDGTLIIRSLSGIYLEKTNWIRVPHRIRAPEDPEGDNPASDEFEYDKKEAYKFNESPASPDALGSRDIAFLYYLQLRDYLAYINEKIGYTNFKKHSKDFYVNDEIANEKDLNNGITWVDPETGSSFKQNKSWVALMNNGGISLADAWGSAINMEGGNIYIQPAKDLVVQPNRNLIAKIGGNVSLAARKELDLSSTEGGLRIKTNLAQYLYSQNSGIVIHADGNDIADDLMTYPNSETMSHVSGIVLRAPDSTISTNSNILNLQAKTSALTQAKQITCYSTNITRLMSKQQSYLVAPRTGIFSSQETISYSSGANLSFGKLYTLVGLEKQDIADVRFMGGKIPVEGILDPNNINAKTNTTFLQDIQKIADTIEEFEPSDLLTVFKNQEDFDWVKFKFLPSSMYYLSDSDVIPQTISQQNATIVNTDDLENWTESEVNSSFPYPGSDKAYSFLVAPCSNSDENLANKAVDMLVSSKQAPFELQNIFTDYQSSL